MIYLAFQLLVDAKLNPRLLFVADRNLRMFDYRQKNRFQPMHVLLGIDSPGKPTLWIDPTRSQVLPGLIPQEFQGTFGLLVDPKDWSAMSAAVPTDPEGMNRQSFDYQVKLEGDRLHLQAKVEFTGQQGFQKRVECLRSEPSTRNRDLKEDFEKRASAWVIREAKVLNAGEPSKPFTWELAGSSEMEDAGRMTITPFPGMPSPYFLPDVWPEVRDARIVLPYLKTHVAECRLTLPKGTRFQSRPDLDENNLFGRVRWSMRSKEGPQGTEVTVRFEVTSQKLTALAEDYGLLRDYLGWIGEAMGRNIMAEKGE